MLRNLSFYSRTAHILLSLSIFLVPLGPVLAAEGESVTELQRNATLHGYASGDESVLLFRLRLPVAGVVTVDLATPAPRGPMAKIDLFHGDASILEQSATHLALAAGAARTLYFRAATEDSQEVLGSYKLTTSFVEAEVVQDEIGSAVRRRFYAAGVDRKSDPEDVNPDPNAVRAGGRRLLASVLFPLSASPAKKSDPEDVDPDPNAARAETLVQEQVLYYEETCVPAGEADDHGDTVSCASPLVLGRSVGGEIGNAWGDDGDVFELVLSGLTTVEIATSGGSDTYGTLFDHRGQRLAVDDDGAGDGNFRIVTTLGPGRYFVRVESAAAADAYELLATARSW